MPTSFQPEHVGQRPSVSGVVGLASLAAPAFVKSSAGWLRTSERLWLDWVLACAETAFSAEFGRRAVCTPVRDSAPPAVGDTALAIQFRVSTTRTTSSRTESSGTTFGRTASSLLVVLDQDAARALADAVALEAAGLRGSGRITLADQGLVEYIALTLTESLVRSFNQHVSSGCEVVITSILSGPAAADALRESSWPRVTVSLSIASRLGRCVVAFDGWSASPTDAPPRTMSRSETNQTLRVSLALPAISLSAFEIANAAVGDLVLLGTSGLDERTIGCTLVASTGWSLASASIASDAPGMISLRCGELNPVPHEGWVCRDESPCLLPLIGAGTLTADELKSWRGGRALDLRKTFAGVELVLQAACWSRGGLVKVENEIAVRIDEFAKPGTPT